MAINSVNPQSLKQTGRARAVDPSVRDVTITHNANFTSEQTYVYDFATINNVAQFGVMKTLFVDNGSGINDIEVSVDDTDQFFTVPDGAQGHFPISASSASKLTLYCAGGAVDIVTVQIMNFEVPPIVWYSYGANNTNTPMQVQGSMNAGATIASESYKRPVFIGATDGTGIFRPVLCDATGALAMSGTISIASITIADGNDAALGATTSPSVVGTANGTLIGLTKNINGAQGYFTDAAVSSGGNGNVIQQLKGLNLVTGATTDASVSSGGNGSTIAQLKGLNLVVGAQADALNTNSASSGTLMAFIKGFTYLLSSLVNYTFRRSTTGTQTNVAAAIADTSILATNTNRRGASIFNDSASANLYLLAATGTASTTVFTVKVPPGGYYELAEQYSGQVRGYWDAAVGSARVTEYT